METTLEDAIRNRLLYIGEEIPTSLVDDSRPKFILLGNPAELIREVTGEEVHYA
jgi:hypothetical protein